MYQPFRLGLCIGVDISRSARFLEHEKPNWHKLDGLLRRLLTPDEVADMRRRTQWYQPGKLEYSPSPQPAEIRELARFTAGRWAAKEAAKKAWGARLVGFRDLTVKRQAEGGINITVAVKSKDNQVYAQEGKLSISHDGEYAMATVIAETLHKDIARELQKQKAEAEDKVGPSLTPTT